MIHVLIIIYEYEVWGWMGTTWVGTDRKIENHAAIDIEVEKY